MPHHKLDGGQSQKTKKVLSVKYFFLTCGFLFPFIEIKKKVFQLTYKTYLYRKCLQRCSLSGLPAFKKPKYYCLLAILQNLLQKKQAAVNSRQSCFTVYTLLMAEGTCAYKTFFVFEENTENSLILIDSSPNQMFISYVMQFLPHLRKTVQKIAGIKNRTKFSLTFT